MSEINKFKSSKKEALILGIETSCDETAAALVKSGRQIIANVVSSQIDLHSKYGGVVPELASRQHAETILPVIAEAVKTAGISLQDIDAVAVTSGPGLIGALLVGVAAAKALAFALDRPLLAVHHLLGHIAANYLSAPELEPPFLSLIVSGAHAHIVFVQDYLQLKLLAQTRDDAAGEVLDKLARAVGLGYPGGPLMERAGQAGSKNAFALPWPKFDNSFDFSFSGVKTAALNILNQAEQKAAKEKIAREEILSTEDFAATVEETITSILADHLIAAQKSCKARTITLAGGVSANKRLREKVKDYCQNNDCRLILPELNLCTDNAAMIASAGYYLWREEIFAPLDLNASALWDIAEISMSQ